MAPGPTGGSWLWSPAKTTAVRDGNEWVINGSKIFITNAACEMSMGVTVQAVTGTRDSGRPEYTCFLVEHGTPGFKAVEMKKKMMWRSSNTAELYFDDVRVPAENIVGQLNNAYAVFNTMMIPERLGTAAMTIGAARPALDIATRYTSRRRAFGQTINQFQGVSFQIAESAMAEAAERALLAPGAGLPGGP